MGKKVVIQFSDRLRANHAPSTSPDESNQLHRIGWARVPIAYKISCHRLIARMLHCIPQPTDDRAFGFLRKDEH
jgi:hypothetical protein